MMRRKLICSVMFLAISAALSYGAPQMANHKDSATQMVTGCIQKGSEGTGYYLISDKGKHWELYSNSDINLADHVGHTVTVTGSVAHRSADQEKVSQPSEKKEMGARKHADLQVTSVKMVSESCK